MNIQNTAHIVDLNEEGMKKDENERYMKRYVIQDKHAFINILHKQLHNKVYTAVKTSF